MASSTVAGSALRAGKTGGGGRMAAAPVRLVAVNRFYAPDTAPTGQLLSELAEHLAAAGVEVAVVTAGQRYDDARADLPAFERRHGVAVHRLRTTRFGRGRLGGRAVDYLSFHLAAALALLRLVRRGDLLLAKTDPPLVSVVAWLVATLRGARLVNWCQDLFPETAAALGLGWAAGPAGRLLRGLRNLSLRGAALNVALCEAMAARLSGEGVPDGRIAVIPNWADGRLVRPVAPADNPLRRAWGLEGRRVIGYAGNLGRAHDLPAVRAFVAAMTAADPELVVLVVGGGSGCDALAAWARAEGRERVLFRPYQPRERLAECLSVADLHLVSLDPACEGLVMPSKLHGVLAAGRPVVALGDPAGSLARLVRELDAGTVWTPGDEAGVLAWLDRARDPAVTARLRRTFEERFERDRVLARWQAALAGSAGPALARSAVPEPAA